MIKPNPFTPQSGWEPKVFGGRHEQIASFTKAMKEAVTGRPNHMVILGEWGIGKTSLLKQLRILAYYLIPSQARIPIKGGLKDGLKPW